MLTMALGGIPYAIAHCKTCFYLQGNRDLLDCLMSKIHCLANQNKPDLRIGHHINICMV